MRKQKTNSPLLFIFIAILALLLPALSFYLASKASLFYENLTYVGNLASNRSLFMVWGILQSLCYFIAYLYVTDKFHTRKKSSDILCAMITLISIIAFVLPYQNHSGDIVSQLHVYGSMSSCIFTFVLVMRQIVLFASIDLYLYEKAKTYFLLILSLFAFLIILFGDISTLSELVLLNGLNFLFVYLIRYRLKPI